MSKKVALTNHWIFLTFILYFPFWAQASCDSCAKAALEATKQAVSQSVSATTDVVKANGETIDAISQSVDSGTDTLSEQLQMLGQQELTALDGVASKISLMIELLSEESARATDTLVNNIQQAEVGLRKADMAIENARMIGPRAQTISGEINTARAQDLSVGFATRQSLKTLHLENMEKWLTDNGYRHSQSTEQAILLARDEYWDVMPLIQKPRLTEDEVNNLQVMFQLLVEPKPQRPITQQEIVLDPTKASAEIDRRRNNTISQVAHSILIDQLSDKAPTIPTSSAWLKHYFAIEPDENGKISFSQFFEAETIGKLTSPAWFLDIKTRTEAGLLREQINQLNTTNALLSEILRAEQQDSKLLALATLKANL